MRQLIIARKDLQMSPGKLAAQCCHASLAFLTDPIGMGQGVEPIEKNGEITGYRAEIMLEKATYEEWFDGSFTKCELDHTTLNECKFVRCEITGLRSTHSSVQSLDFEDCRLQEIEWAPLMSNGAFPDPIHTLKECSLKYNTFTEMNFNRFDFSDGNEIVGSMFAKCEMQLANFKDVELHETEFYQCDLRKADFRDAAGYKVDILGSRLKDAKFSLPEAVNLLADLKIKLS